MKKVKYESPATKVFYPAGAARPFMIIAGSMKASIHGYQYDGDEWEDEL